MTLPKKLTRWPPGSGVVLHDENGACVVIAGFGDTLDGEAYELIGRGAILDELAKRYNAHESLVEVVALLTEVDPADPDIEDFNRWLDRVLLAKARTALDLAKGGV